MGFRKDRHTPQTVYMGGCVYMCGTCKGKGGKKRGAVIPQNPCLREELKG